jgi:hypothetical protein
MTESAAMSHPALIRRLRDLPLDYLIDHKIARLLPPVDWPLHDRFLAQSLAAAADRASLVAAVEEIADSAAIHLADPAPLEEALALLPSPEGEGAPDFGPWAAATGRLLLAALGEAPHDPALPLEAQLPLPAATYRSALALARQGARRLAGDATILLPAPPLPRPEVPADGGGEIETPEIIEIGDFTDRSAARGHVRARAALAGLPVRWRWLHGPTGRSEDADSAAGFAEIVREAAPDRFWEAVEKLYRTYALGETGHVTSLPGVPAGGADALFLSLDERYQEPVRRDAAMVNVCAVPPVRPAFVIGRKPFLGEGAVDALRAEVERLRKG